MVSKAEVLLSEEEDSKSQMKSLNKVRLEQEGKILKNFEAMDLIYHRVRNRTNEGLLKLEPLLK